jgi:hypothetical protein
MEPRADYRADIAATAGWKVAALQSGQRRSDYVILHGDPVFRIMESGVEGRWHLGEAMGAFACQATEIKFYTVHLKITCIPDFLHAQTNAITLLVRLAGSCTSVWPELAISNKRWFIAASQPSHTFTGTDGGRCDRSRFFIPRRSWCEDS